VPTFGQAGCYDRNKLSTELNKSAAGEFEKILQACFLEGLKLILGESGSQAVLSNWDLENSLGDPKKFHEKLFSYLGEPGTPVIERAIAKLVFRTIGQPYPKSEAFDFELLLEFAKRGYDQSNSVS
jgi:hypothetical protein